MAYAPVRHSSLTYLSNGIQPDYRWFCVGGYEGGAIVAEIDELYGFVNKPDESLLRCWSRCFPESLVLVVELGSVTNYFAYGLYRGTQCLRALSGDSDHPLTLEKGDLQAQEEKFYANSEIRDGERVFKVGSNGVVRKYRFPEIGEALAFAMAARFFGQPLDEFPMMKLEVEIFKDSRPWWPFRKKRP